MQENKEARQQGALWAIEHDALRIDPDLHPFSNRYREHKTMMLLMIGYEAGMRYREDRDAGTAFMLGATLELIGEDTGEE